MNIGVRDRSRQTRFGLWWGLSLNHLKIFLRWSLVDGLDFYKRLFRS